MVAWLAACLMAGMGRPGSLGYRGTKCKVAAYDCFVVGIIIIIIIYYIIFILFLFYSITSIIILIIVHRWLGLELGFG